MQTKEGSKKEKKQSSPQKTKSMQNKTILKKPSVSASALDKMIQTVLNNPDSMTRDEFVLFQQAIGLRQANKLMEEGKRRKNPEKGEQSDKTAKSPADNKDQKLNMAHTEKSEGNIVIKSDDIKNNDTQISASKEVKTQKAEGVQKVESSPIAGKKENKQPIKATKETSKVQSDNIQKAKSVDKDEKANHSQVNKKAVIEKEDKQPGEKKTTVNLNNEKQLGKPEKMNLKEMLGTDKKEQGKAPKVEIKLGEPSEILNQLGNVPATQAISAYSDAAAISGKALEKQKQKTQAVIPQIPTPTGLAPLKSGGGIKKKIETVKHTVLSAFKSEKHGGKTSEGMPSELRIDSGSEPNPEEIMAEARQFSANTPEISMTGEADTNQVDGFRSEAAQSVQEAKQAELGQIGQDFGENDIFPKEDNTILKAKHSLKSREVKIAKMNNTFVVPGEMENQLNKTLGPEFKKQIGEQKNKYHEGKEKFDADVTNAKTDSHTQMGQLKKEAQTKQLNEQAGAKAEVERLRGQWKNEIHGAVAEYDHQAEAETKSKTSEISNVKKEKDKEIKARMAKAEQDAHQEYKSAKKKADDKKKEGEKEDKPWYVKAGEWIKDKAEKFVNALKEAVNAIYNGLRSIVKGIFELAKAAVTGIIELGRQMIVGIIKGLGTFLKGLVKIVFAKFPGISNKICGFIDNVVNKSVKIVNDTANFLKKGISDVLDYLASTVDKLLEVVQSLYNGIFTFVGMIISGKFAEIMKGIASLGKAAKESLKHIEGAVWEQLIGVDISKPLGQEAPQTDNNSGSNEKLTENDIDVDHVEDGEIPPELLASMNLKDGEVKEIQGSSEPQTVDSIMNDFDTGKEAGKAETSFVEGAKMRAENGRKILDQMKGFVIKWLKENWGKILLGVLGALAGIVALEIVTGGAITAALPTIITVITNLMNAGAVISIVDTIAKAAGYIETFLTQGWIGKTVVAAIALATAMAMGLVELAMDLGFKAVGAGLKSAGKAVKKGVGAAAKGAKNLAQAAGKGMKSLLKSGARLVSKSGSMIIQNGKLIIKGLQKGFSKGAKKLGNLIDKFLSKFKFKKFKLERKGKHIRMYGEVNPWVLLYDGKIEEVDSKKINPSGGSIPDGHVIDYNGQKGVVISSLDETKRLNKLSKTEREQVYQEAVSKGVANPITKSEYKSLRKKTPNDDIREMVNPEGTKVDPVYGYVTDVLEADHIVSMKEIVDMPGFSKLTREQQIEVLNLKDNFIGLGKSTNASKGAKDWATWKGHSKLGEVPSDVRDRMLELESSARKALMKAIEERLNK